MVIDALILYFTFVLPRASLDAATVLMIFIGVGLSFPCVAAILVSLFLWERRNIFVFSVFLYGLIIFTGSVYYIYLLPSLALWGILFALIGIVVMYFPIRHLRRSRSE